MRDGLSSYCAECHCAAARESRARHGARYNAAKRSNLTDRLSRAGIEPESTEAVFLRAVACDPCAYCGGPATDLDHIDPRKSGNDGWDNRAAACGTCNKRKQRLSLLGFMLRRSLVRDGFDEMREQWKLAA